MRSVPVTLRHHGYFVWIVPPALGSVTTTFDGGIATQSEPLPWMSAPPMFPSGGWLPFGWVTPHAPRVAA